MNKNYLLLFLLSYFGFSQCPYPTANTQNGTVQTFCVDLATNSNLSFANVNSTNFLAFNVVQGFTYRFTVAANLYSANENITIYDFTTNALLANVSGTAGATLNWTATLSGQIKVVLSEGACIQTSTANTTLLAQVVLVGNTLDSQTTFGINNWIGHVYDWQGAADLGGASPTTPTASTPFATAQYVGNFPVTTQNFVQGYGGNNVCFPVLSNGVNRMNIRTETFAVRYRMRSTLPAGCYIVTLRGDDGIRLYIDNVLVFNSWVQQAPNTYGNVLVYLNGNSDIIYDYFENLGQNVADIAMAPFTPSTNTIAVPVPATVCSGVTPPILNATSYVYNGGAVNPTTNYQWQVSTDNVTFNNISGANLEDYTPPAITTSTTQIHYYRRIVSAAANAAACNFESSSIQITTSGTTLASPTATLGTAANCNSFFANWNAVPGATSYTLDVSTTNTFATFVVGYNNINVGNVTTTQVTGLAGNTAYFYRLRAISGCGASNLSNTITYGTQPVTTPNTTLTANGCGQFTINWTAIPNATSYQVDISNVNNFASFITGYNNLNVGNVISFTTGLLTDATVFIRIRAVGPCGSSGNSGTSTVNVGTTTWNGTSWSNGTPTLMTVANINGTYITSTDGDFDACRVLISTSGNLTIAPDDFVTIQNELQNSGSVTVQSSGSLVQINNTAVNTGNIIVQRVANNVVVGQDYVYWSAPVIGQNLGTLFSASPFRYRWGTTAPNANGGEGNWLNYSGAMNIGNGYIVRDISTANFTGVPHNGSINVAVFRGNDYSGLGTQHLPRGPFDDNWNLLGNPYPSALGVKEFLTANTVLEGFVKLWSHGTPPNSTVSPFYQFFASNYDVNDYITYNPLGSTSGPGDFKIASGQGFMTLMVAGNAGSGNVVFNNAMRSKTFGNNQFYRATNTTTPTTSRIWLDLVSPLQTNRILVGYTDEATNGLDRLYDAFTDYKPTENFYSLINNAPFLIQGKALPFENSDIIPLGFKAATNGNYSIAIATVDGLFSNNAQTIFLEDKLLNIVHNLSINPYPFTTTSGIHNNRFVLRYTDQLLNINAFDLVNYGVTIFASNEGIQINSKLSDVKSYKIYNVLGQILTSANNINSSQHTIKNLSKTNQTLLVKASLVNGQIVTKKVLF